MESIISNENIIIEDSRSENLLKRTYTEKFVLKSMGHDRTKQYFLVMHDVGDSNGTYARIPYTMDITIVDEFYFLKVCKHIKGYGYTLDNKYQLIDRIIKM